jgi:hypothetical protein
MGSDQINTELSAFDVAKASTGMWQLSAIDEPQFQGVGK